MNLSRLDKINRTCFNGIGVEVDKVGSLAPRHVQNPVEVVTVWKFRRRPRGDSRKVPIDNIHVCELVVQYIPKG